MSDVSLEELLKRFDAKIQTEKNWIAKHNAKIKTFKNLMKQDKMDVKAFLSEKRSLEMKISDCEGRITAFMVAKEMVNDSQKDFEAFVANFNKALQSKDLAYKTMEKAYIDLSKKLDGLRKLRNNLKKQQKISDDELTRLETEQKKTKGSAREAITRTMYFLNGEIQNLEKVLKRLDAQLGS